MKRLLIAAGGTGGHLYPALALAEELAARGMQPLVLTPSGRPAAAILEAHSIAHLEVDLPGWKRDFGPRAAALGWKLVRAFRLARNIISDFSPDAVIGMGGSAALPALIAAWSRGVPRAVHESNASLGLSNKIGLALGARLFRGLPGGGCPPEDVVGTPIRRALWSRESPGESRRTLGLRPGGPLLLVMGGSQGAAAFNRAVPAAAAGAGASRSAFQILHLAGRGKSAETRSSYELAGVAALVHDYQDDMAAAYAAADLVLCRSGASTLAELAAQGKPAILVPYPHAAAGHQEENARVFAARGAAVLLREQDLENGLPGLLSKLLAGSDAPLRLGEMAQGCAALGLPAPAASASLLADALERLAR